MYPVILNNVLRFIFLVLLQGLVLNYIELSGYINPFVYVLFILMLPFETPGWLLMLLGFLTGLSIDMFTGTIGLHTSAGVFVAFARIYVYKIFAPSEGYEFGMQPRLTDMGFQWFIITSSILVLLHHLWLFQVEFFKLSDLGDSLFKTLLSGIFTIVLILIFQYLLYGRSKKDRS